MVNAHGHQMRPMGEQKRIMDIFTMPNIHDPVFIDFQPVLTRGPGRARARADHCAKPE